MKTLTDIQKFLEELRWLIHSPYLEDHVRELRIDEKNGLASISLEDGTLIAFSWIKTEKLQ